MPRTSANRSPAAISIATGGSGFEACQQGQERVRDRPVDRVKAVGRLEPVLFAVEQQRETWPGHLMGDGRLHNALQSEFRRRRLGRGVHRGDQQAGLPRDQGRGQRVLAGEVLVDRPDRDAGPLSHGIGRVAGQPALLQNTSRAFEDRPHRLGRPRLFRVFPGLKRRPARRPGGHEREFAAEPPGGIIAAPQPTRVMKERMSNSTFNPKLTVFMLVKTSPEWLAMSIDDRFARLREVFEPILRRHADSVTLRFYDAEFYTARFTDLWVWEASEHHAYESVVEALRETPF